MVRDERIEARQCSVDGCIGELVANGYCSKHYQRVKRVGKLTPRIVYLGKNPTSDRILTKLLSSRHVTSDGCWEWRGSAFKSGYGRMWLDGKTRLIHRVSAWIFLGFDLGSNDFICHKCDNPPCFNPEHLFIGNRKTNSQDVADKDRRKGSRHPMARLKESDILEIRKLLSDGAGCADVARRFGVTRQHVRRIRDRKMWKHVMV